MPDADLNAKNRYGNTALIDAVLNTDIETAKLLIEADADLDIQKEFWLYSINDSC